MSDQDFFFDEDEATPEKTAEAPKKSASSKPAASKEPAAAVAASGEQSVSLTVTVLVAVVAVLVGVILGIFIGRGLAAPAPVATGMPGSTAPANQPAPQLTPEQLQGGEMPPGHPPVGGDAGAATGTAEPGGSTETTKSE
ncbi:MAG: hypothetical protein U1E26_04610 [Coriobacteriia bacterium]|nr:hypothetical protein [Coriobacteriia bacterium]